MDLMEAVKARHSVRKYRDIPLEDSVVHRLQDEIETVNRAGKLDFSLRCNEPKAFSSKIASYGSFRGVSNYILLAAAPGNEEAVGYYGERLVLFAQTLGLNTCWVGLTYGHKEAKLNLPVGEKLYLVIAVGYGDEQGHPHKSKPVSALTTYVGAPVAWFDAGMEAAALAPTAVNQQRFLIQWDGDDLSAKALFGPFSKVDLGIVKYHFELGAAAAGHPVVWSR